jgi:hypothetical protein
MVYAPSPMNQFNRLVLVSGTKPTGLYQLGSPWNNVYNGRDYDSANCTATSGAILRDATTGGRSKCSPNLIRNNQNDFTGGIGWDDVNVAYSRLGWPTLYRPGSDDWADVIAYLRQGRPVGVGYDYDQVPYVYQEQKGGTFDHACVLTAYRGSDGAILYYDPLGRRAKWVPQYVVRAGAQKLALAQRGDRGRLFILVGPPMPTPAPSNYRVSIQPLPGQTYRNFWSYSVSAVHGRITGRVGVRTKGFSASSTAPSRRYWTYAGKSYVLVKLTSGSRAGQWVHAAYAEEV